jgi:hypothetical protein
VGIVLREASEAREPGVFLEKALERASVKDVDSLRPSAILHASREGIRLRTYSCMKGNAHPKRVLLVKFIQPQKKVE